jgi:hypothetical protein
MLVKEAVRQGVASPRTMMAVLKEILVVGEGDLDLRPKYRHSEMSSFPTG